MKINLLRIVLISLFVVDVEASNIPEIIMQSPIASAAIGYVVGNIGHQVVNGCNLNPVIPYIQTSDKKEFALLGLQFMGVSMYVYQDYLQGFNEQEIDDSSHAYYDISRSTNKKLCKFDSEENLASIYYRDSVHTKYYGNDEDEHQEFGSAIIFDLKPIASGLLNAVICGSAAWLTAP